MSFAFEGTFTSVGVALKFISRQHAPAEVIQYIERAVMGLKGAVHIKANGHLFDGPGSYRTSTCGIVVEEVNLISEVA